MEPVRPDPGRGADLWDGKRLHAVSAANDPAELVLRRALLSLLQSTDGHGGRAPLLLSRDGEYRGVGMAQLLDQRYLRLLSHRGEGFGRHTEGQSVLSAQSRATAL